MLRTRLCKVASLALLLIPATILADETITLKTIMQGLRNDLVTIADGLLLDDFEQVARGAASIADHPTIPPGQIQLVAAELGPEMPAFKQFDTLVHDLSLDVHAAAGEQDRPTAIAGYRRLLEGCLACHAAYKDRIAAVLSDAEVD